MYIYVHCSGCYVLNNSFSQIILTSSHRVIIIWKGRYSRTQKLAIMFSDACLPVIVNVILCGFAEVENYLCIKLFGCYILSCLKILLKIYDVYVCIFNNPKRRKFENEMENLFETVFLCVMVINGNWSVVQVVYFTVV